MHKRVGIVSCFINMKEQYLAEKNWDKWNQRKNNSSVAQRQQLMYASMHSSISSPRPLGMKKNQWNITCSVHIKFIGARKCIIPVMGYNSINMPLHVAWVDQANHKCCDWSFWGSGKWCHDSTDWLMTSQECEVWSLKPFTSDIRSSSVQYTISVSLKERHQPSWIHFLHYLLDLYIL